MSRAMFAAAEVVELKQLCLTPAQLFQPGKYRVEQLPDIAFEMGLVEKLPPSNAPAAKTEQSENRPKNEL